jgi:hypothetical protein
MKRSVNEYDENRGGGGLRKAAEIGAFTAGGAGLMAGPIKVASLTGQKVADDKQNKADREAASEMKRESRGVAKPANFDAIEEAKQEAKDRADAKKQDKAYNESLTTENKAKGGMTAKFMSFSKKGKPAGMKSVTKMASGGMTASSRADGCCTKGKTRGKMV